MIFMEGWDERAKKVRRTEKPHYGTLANLSQISFQPSKTINFSTKSFPNGQKTTKNTRKKSKNQQKTPLVLPMGQLHWCFSPKTPAPRLTALKSELRDAERRQTGEVGRQREEINRLSKEAAVGWGGLVGWLVGEKGFWMVWGLMDWLGWVGWLVGGVGWLGIGVLWVLGGLERW